MSKTIKIILMFVLILTLSACQSETPNPTPGGNDETNPPINESEETPEFDRRAIPDELPDTDLGGREFNLLCHEMLTVEFVAEEQNGDTVNDALYKRNTDVSERFNVVINMIQIPGSWDDREPFMRTVRNSVQAGDATYDLVAGVTSYIPLLIPQGIFMDINTVGHLDFAKPWWGEDWITELSIGDKLYLVTGDIALSMWDCMFVFYFNKQLVQDNDLPDLYETVKSGQWTFDKFSELSKTISKDLNGDGVYDKNDMFGFVTTTGTVVNAFPGGFDLAITYKDENNIPHPQLNIEKWSDAAAKLFDLHHNTQSTLVLPPDASDYNIIVPMFQENRALFFPQTLSFAGTMRAMETDFGILPFPMYDGNQKNYCSVIRNAMSLIGIPATVSSPGDCGLIMAALAAESYKTVIPAYYDIALKVKQTRDDESGEMLDIIRGSIWMNFGYSYSLSTGGIGNYMRELIEQKNPNFTSVYDASIASRTKIFDKFIADVLNLGT